MPKRRKTSLSKQTYNAKRNRELRAVEDEVERDERLLDMRNRMRESRRNETNLERANRLDEQRERTQNHRNNENTQQRQDRLENARMAQLELRRGTNFDMKKEAFNYNSLVDYNSHSKINIGYMDVTCAHCSARKFQKEAPGMCCCNGKVSIAPLREPPEPLLSLTSGTTEESKTFLQNIRRYNSCFQMTSFGATKVVTEAGYMPTFKIQGQVYHQAGSLLPEPDQDPKFLQIYFMGNSEIETARRCESIPGVDREIVERLQQMLHEGNNLVRMFKSALERMPDNEYKIVIRADKTPVGEHVRRFNAPISEEVAIIIVGNEYDKRDIVLHKRSDALQRISETHRSYDALQYPLLFWEGEDGYNFNVQQIHPVTHAPTDKKVSAMNFYAYRIMIRGGYNHLLHGGRLFQQFLVDMYAKIESERLLYLRLNQKKLRAEEYVHLRDAISGESNVEDIGKMVILPSTFAGSPRHMQEYTQDAMTYVRNHGRPDLFITFTCNPKWVEIESLLFPGQTAEDRQDLIARVFKLKLTKLMDLIVKSQIYGEVQCFMYTIEWQKRGLPHAHILIWLKEKIHSDHIDKIISAEIPDKEEDPLLFEVITTSMIHGPCGTFNPKSPCMKDGHCTKRYPRNFLMETQTGQDGYPAYRRRKPEDGGHVATVKIKQRHVQIDNRWVVPYTPLLSKIFKAHINVEYCNSVKSIKYICKYINKGSDMAIISVTDKNDEITQYQMGRYISSNEAVWRILSFPIHERHPTVIHLAVHLENGQRVTFTAQNAAELAANPPNTTLTAFFKLCTEDPFARTLLYPEVPQYYTWNSSRKQFSQRKQGAVVHGTTARRSDALGRVYTVHPNNAECFYLRMLLHVVKGPTSFEDLRIVEGELCSTYRQACQKLGLLEDDQHWDTALSEASTVSMPYQMRLLFAIILTTCAPSDPKFLWEKYRFSLSEDYLLQWRRAANDPNFQMSDIIYEKALIDIENTCLSIINKTLDQLGLASPSRGDVDIIDTDIARETNYNREELFRFVETNEPLMTEDQKIAFEILIDRITSNTGGIFFLDAPGGTGKTFLLNLILAEVRKIGNIALAVASSGIAATLLAGGRTAHSALKLPLNLSATDAPICNIRKNSGQAKILKTCKIIIWDECTMANKKALEALDRTLQDLRGNEIAMGGALLLLAGDFRQTLPVIQRGTAADEINACLKSSYLWRGVEKLTLSTNMRVRLQGDDSSQEFSQQLLQIGEGRFMNTPGNYSITFPENFCNLSESVDDVVNSVFHDIGTNFKNHEWLRERAILAPRNDQVTSLNISIQHKLPGPVTTYKSIDTVIDQEQAVNYPVEFLNSLEPSGMPPHQLFLKVGSPIMMLRNLTAPKLCNGTRLIVKHLHNNIIEATILSGKSAGEDVLIPRIPLIPSDMPFEFRRLQFPVRLAFAMTINKAQGQSLNVAGVHLEPSCFSHGQLYVACSRVGNPKKLYVYAPNNTTNNVVYPNALR